MEKQWVRSIPKGELHRHLQGSIRTSTILDIGRKYNIPLPADSVGELDEFVKYKKPAKDLSNFLEPWNLFSRIVVDSDVVFRIAYEAIEDAAKDNIAYMELRFAPYTMSSNNNLTQGEILSAVATAVEEAKQNFPIIVKIVLGIARVDVDGYFNYNVGILEAAQAYRDLVVGFDLTGDEASFPACRYTDFFRLVKEQGFKVTVHAGEAAGPNSVREAIELLGADRIGHGINALKDPDVIRLLIYSPLQHGPIPLEICPTSAYLTGTLQKSQVIPSIRQFLDYGVPVTISADNPQVCDTTLSDEFEWLIRSESFQPQEIFAILRNAIDHSFASPNTKVRLHRSLTNAFK